MAFHDVQFPDSIAQGAQVTPGFSTSLVMSSGGHEQRVGNWSLPRRAYDVGTGLKRRTDTQALLAFWIARGGRLHGFRFKDWSDYEMARQAIGTTDGADATWPLFKSYTSGPTTVQRPITRPVSGTVQVWVNNVAIALGAGAGEFQVNLATGVITLGATLAATTAQAIEAACQFDVPARFDSDEIALTQRSHELGEWPAVPVVEIRE
jgi:uncharacterized protein (TIGR02217 family)